MKVRVKVCGVRTPRDAAVVEAAGADFIGVILSPGYFRSVEVEQAFAIYEAARARRAGVFVDARVERVVQTAQDLALDVVQLGGSETVEAVREVGGAGDWAVWKTIHAKPGVSMAEAAAPHALVASGILVDAWDPSLPGGTGQTFAWAGVGREVRRAIGSASFIAAGGMTPENAGAAVAALGPDVLDVSSGVESVPGTKNPGRTRAFVDAVRRAGAGGQ